MLVKPPLEKLLPKVENRYTLSILIAKRARQLVDGALPLTRELSPSYVTVACEELAANRVSCVKGQVEPHIPLRPEVEAARLAAREEAEQARLADAVKEELERAGSLPAEPLEKSDVNLFSEMLMKSAQELAVASDQAEAAQAAEPAKEQEAPAAEAEPAAAEAETAAEATEEEVEQAAPEQDQEEAN